MGTLETIFFVLWAGLGVALLVGPWLLVRKGVGKSDKREFLKLAAVLAVPGLFITWTVVVRLAEGGEEEPPAYTTVDRRRSTACVAEVLGAEEQPRRVRDHRVYKLRTRVQISGQPVYETISTAALNAFQQGELGARLGNEKRRYHCLADREKPQRVEVLMDRPIG